MRRALTLLIQTPITLDSLAEVLSEYATEPVIHNKDQHGNDRPIQLLLGCEDGWEQNDVLTLVDRLKLRDMTVEVVK